MSRLSVAVIGTGIAGMSCAYFLRRDCAVTLFEKDARPGGHTHTVSVPDGDRQIPIDTGFMVYNETTYPGLTRLFRELNIPTQNTSMSFSVRREADGVEYSGTGLSGLFAQRANLFKLSHWRLLGAIDRFNRVSREVLDDPSFEGFTVADYVKAKNWSRDLLDHYLMPMSGAIWSSSPARMEHFPIRTLVRFFKNHGLLGLSGHLQWRTVTGGSRVYRDEILKLFSGAVRTGQAVVSVRAEGGRAVLRTASGEQQVFDRAVLAGHADQSLGMLESPTTYQHDVLSVFGYQRNRALLHTDERVMPRCRQAWSSWNARVEADGTPSVAYWMNSLQNVSQTKNYFVSINDPGRVRPQTVLWSGEYDHPLFTIEAVRAQARLERLNETGPLYFCGSYFKYGFHEDALASGLSAARAVLGKDPWP